MPGWSWVADSAALVRAVRSARQARGLQQSDLAERLAVSRMTVSRLEHGEPVAMELAARRSAHRFSSTTW
jgi:transcriptional regulator with XRE-family HTH domain